MDGDYAKDILAILEKVHIGETIDVADLGLSTRTTNGLRNAGYCNVNDLFNSPGIMHRLKHTSQIGKRSLYEISDVLTMLGVDTKMPALKGDIETFSLADLKARVITIRNQRNVLLSELLAIKAKISLMEKATATVSQRESLAHKYPDVAPLALAGLSEREITVLCCRSSMTQKAVGGVIGVTASRAREIEMRAYRILRHSSVRGVKECIHALGLCDKSGLCNHGGDNERIP